MLSSCPCSFPGHDAAPGILIPGLEQLNLGPIPDFDPCVDPNGSAPGRQRPFTFIVPTQQFIGSINAAGEEQ
jgi:hypothetical protein